MLNSINRKLTDRQLDRAYARFLSRMPKTISPAQAQLPIPDIYQYRLFTDPNKLYLDFTTPVACSLKSHGRG